MKEALPSTGLEGIIHHWKDDLSAAISVTLVALPLALGIALASGVPPMAGIIAVIIGGVVTTIFRGSYLAINGPAAGLIVVILAGMESLTDENGSGFPYVLAATVVAGAIQALLGLLKMGKLGDLFPASVINGMLATIGLTILLKQFPVALGVDAGTGTVLYALLEIPNSILNMNVLVTLVAGISLFILISHPKIKNKIIKNIPAPLLVLIISIPMVLFFQYLGSKDTKFLNQKIDIDPEYLVQIPENLMDSLMFPNFSKIMLPEFWLLVISITLVGSIITLISAKAVDKLDDFKRRTDLNKDLMAMGISTFVSGFLGGLPIITVIVRSSVNVSHHAKTKWSNFYHGVFMLLFVFLFPFVINEIPQASLAAILVYAGFKLASPKMFKATLLKGWEQLLILITTLVASLATDILWGVSVGVLTTLTIHWIKSSLNLKTFFKHLFHAEINVVEESKKVMHVEIKGIANFVIMLRMINSLKQLKSRAQNVIVDFSRTKLVDSTILDFIHEHREKYFTDTNFEFVGLDVHKTSSPHPLALHVLERPMQKRLTTRQNDLNHFASGNKYTFSSEINWKIQHLEKFTFFEHHLLEYHRNRLVGDFENGVSWIISDITYNDGVMMAREQHHITGMLLFLDKSIPAISITKDNIREIKAKMKESEQQSGNQIHLSTLDQFLFNNPSYYIEAIDNEVFIYRKERLLSSKEIIELHDFARALYKILPE